jgi:ribonuclease R
MSKVIYDRSGKPHTIGGKGPEEKEPAAGSGSTKSKKFSAKSGSSSRDDRKAGDSGSRPSRDDRKSTAGKAGGGANRFDRDRPNRSDSKNRFEKPKASGNNSGGGFITKPRTEKGAVRGAKFTPEETRKMGGGFSRDQAPAKEGKYPSRRTVKNEAKKAKSAGGGYQNEKHGKFSKNKEPGSRNPKGGKHGKKSGAYKPPQEGKARPKREPDPSWLSLKGIVDKNKRGTGFIVFDNRKIEDAFVPRYLDSLFHGDRVQVYLNDEGEIEDLKVLEHRFKTIFGKVHFEDNYDVGSSSKRNKSTVREGFLIYERKKAKEEVYLASVPPEVKEGDWVKADLEFGENNAVTATVSEVIGAELPAIYDIQMVAGEFNLKEHHTFDAVKQAESYTLEVPGKDEEGRTDLRHLPFITIDGERARDFDDAVYVEDLGSEGFKLWVAIADVSHYVKKGTPLDDEAYARATSVYFPERAFHMLPRALSEELCSLKPKVPRLAMATSIHYSVEGAKGEVKVYNALIESRRRSTYTEIEAEKAQPEHATMMALYKILKRQRHARGSIDFDFPESEIILDEKTGEPTDIVVRERNDAHRLIEEFMIAANESVTEWMMKRKLPFIYRVHSEPSPEAIVKFIKLAKTMGVNLVHKGEGVPRPRVLAEFITTLKGHPAEPVLATALLRSMRQAVYSADYNEHYGLASDGYTHFTSPIRRYPDLIVHRLLREALRREEEHDGRPSQKSIEDEQKLLTEMAEHCSYRERVATEAERESIRFKQVRLMAKHIGEDFEGKVNGMTEKGMFIQLWHPYCEGMVSVDTMKDDWYEFNDERMAMVGRRKKKTFQIGTKVKVKVVKVDFDSRRVEFELWD